MATHSSLLACRIPWTKEPGRLQSIGLKRIEHLSLSDLALTQTLSLPEANLHKSLTVFLKQIM